MTWEINKNGKSDLVVIICPKFTRNVNLKLNQVKLEFRIGLNLTKSEIRSSWLKVLLGKIGGACKFRALHCLACGMPYLDIIYPNLYQMKIW